jgi:hypothetical protein
MRYDQWIACYEEIMDELGFKRCDDDKATSIISKLVRNKNLATVSELAELIYGKHVYIFGAGKSLEEKVKNGTLHQIDSFCDDESTAIIAVDGATSALLKNNIMPDIIMTDLDGNVDDQIAANEQGAIVVIHAHGHNMAAMKKYMSRFTGKIFATTQSTPIKNVHNFCGFTDGDRAVFMAEYFMARCVKLIGFDFSGEASEFSPTESAIKAKKMLWGKILIERIKRDKETEMEIELL